MIYEWPRLCRVPDEVVPPNDNDEKEKESGSKSRRRASTSSDHNLGYLPADDVFILSCRRSSCFSLLALPENNRYF